MNLIPNRFQHWGEIYHLGVPVEILSGGVSREGSWETLGGFGNSSREGCGGILGDVGWLVLEILGGSLKALGPIWGRLGAQEGAKIRPWNAPKRLQNLANRFVSQLGPQKGSKTDPKELPKRAPTRKHDKLKIDTLTQTHTHNTHF